MWILWALLSGIVVGIFSGLLGLAGGILLLPILIYGFKMHQKLAQGTSLAVLLPPTGILGFLEYYRAGDADIKLGLFIATGIVGGAWLGARWAQHVPAMTLRRGFAIFLGLVAVKLFFEK